MALGITGLALLFLLTAGLYASVGFGGGSTYIALLALADLDYRLLPIIALICNIIVVLGGTVRFQARGLIDWRRIWPILLLSVPAAWVGGRLAIDQDNFLVLLGLSLTVAALLLLTEPFFRSQTVGSRPQTEQGFWFAPIVGCGIGFLSGMVGIGGGIFLAPILLLMNWSDSRRIAATASVFILVNSASGLIGQLMKSAWQQEGQVADMLLSYWPLFLGVLVGGQIGSFLASKALREHWIRRLTALLILYVAGRIFWQQFG
ncbi:sulfite exporter TauE/SafE family protein [Parasphingorhabdus litoris]|uniref:Probable membrane transporter protein n=1 Tax=Parasphingorhabdus litoris TaxID=394733 RepID=A0ABP3KJV3_9SPHN|nr:sulfite exporter TauE/SafE family protein [Parasphingorhabdus litoris]